MSLFLTIISQITKFSRFFFVSLHLHNSLRLNCELTSWVEKDIVSDSEVIRKLESPYQ